MKNVTEVLKRDPLLGLVEEDAFVGWVYRIGYDKAEVLTNDLWKTRAGGVPHNSFLVGASFDAESFANLAPEEREVLLLRVTGTAPLPSDPDLLRARVDHFQRQRSRHARELDEITQSQLQFGGLECQILGTFFVRNGDLRLGSDQESFVAAGRMDVYRPRGQGLDLIINFVDPDVRHRIAEEAAERGIPGNGDMRFRLGTVRYTSTDRVHRSSPAQLVPVSVASTDFLARRTAVFGMTRTGKSNTVKHLVSAVKRVADESQVPIGQLIYDLRGEYANPNRQDLGAIAKIYPADTESYRLLASPGSGFRMLRVNFFTELEEGHSIIRQVLRESGSSTAQDRMNFLALSFDEPDDRGDHNRWQVKCAAYRTLLHRAGFDAPKGYKIRFPTSKDVRQAVQAQAPPGVTLANPDSGVTLDEATEWFLACREANRATTLRSTGSGGTWLTTDTESILNMLAQRNNSNAFINGFLELRPVSAYHTPERDSDLRKEIYDLLTQGRIVILDLSVGPIEIRDRLSKRIAEYIFQTSMKTFLEDKRPPHIVVYIEEAHNLIGKTAELIDTWPTLAKEGAKFGIGLVYATQEPSSVHPNILANTENWIVTHLNNDDELRTVAKFYDFADFVPSLKRATDVGFARVRTLSGKFVVPVQIDKFEPTQPASSESSTADSGTEGQEG